MRDLLYKGNTNINNNIKQLRTWQHIENRTQEPSEMIPKPYVNHSEYEMCSVDRVEKSRLFSDVFHRRFSVCDKLWYKPSVNDSAENDPQAAQPSLQSESVKCCHTEKSPHTKVL